MPSRLMPAAAALFVVLAGSCLASPCADRINALETRVNEMAEATASASSGGQGVAAARESQAMQARNREAPIAPPTGRRSRTRPERRKRRARQPRRAVAETASCRLAQS